MSQTVGFQAATRLSALLSATALLASCGPRAIELPTDLVERAATCGVVAAVDAREKTKTIKGPLPFEAQTRIIHYAMLGASEGPEFEPGKAAAVVKLMPELESKVTARKWQTLVEPCGQAFPATAVTGPITLPKDRLDAELGCDGVAAFVERAVQSPEEAPIDQIARYHDLRAKLDKDIGLQLKRRGQSSFEDVQAARQKAMVTAVKLGPPDEVMKQCLAEYS